MGKIEELIDEKINDWDDCLNRHYAGETQNSDVLIRAALSDMEQLKSSLPTTEITELQAWKKIAEVTDTDEPTFNPADFYHDMRILFKNAKFDVPVRGDKTLYDNGYRIVHKSSLPTQQDKVVVPGEIIEWFVETLDGKERFDGNDVFRIIQDVLKVAEGYETWNDYNIDEKIAEYAEKNEENFLKLLVNCSKDNGYTVEKEPLYIVPLPQLITSDGAKQYLTFDKDGLTYFASRKSGYLYQYFTAAEIECIPENYKAFAVPVEEEAE